MALCPCGRCTVECRDFWPPEPLGGLVGVCMGGRSGRSLNGHHRQGGGNTADSELHTLIMKGIDGEARRLGY